MKVGDRVGRCLFANRPCDRVVGKQSGMAFIAVPSDDEYHWETEAAKQVVIASQITPVVAVHKNLLSEDVFCQKICTPIVQSRFCIVFLNGGNPNVFYEYGLMRPFRKRVISLQREEEKLPFNVQHLDTLRYQQKDLRECLTEAVDVALQATKQTRSSTAKRSKPPPSPFTARVSKLLELEGLMDYTGYGLSGCTSGSAFSAKERNGRLYLVAIMEAEWNLQEVLADTMVVCRRLDRIYSTLQDAVRVKQDKGWGSVDEQRRTVDTIAHLQLIYATPHQVSDEDGATILAAVHQSAYSYPLPTVDIWKDTDVEARFGALLRRRPA